MFENPFQLLIIFFGMLLVALGNVTVADAAEPNREKVEKMFSLGGIEGFKRGEDQRIIAMGEVAKEFLLEKLQSSDDYEKEKAIVLLGRMRDADLVEPLAKFLKEGNRGKYDQLAVRAAAALGTLGRKEAIPHLSAVLDPKLELELSRAAIGALLYIWMQNYDPDAVRTIKEFCGKCDLQDPAQKYLKDQVENRISFVERYHKDNDSRRQLLLETLRTGEFIRERQGALQLIRKSKDKYYLAGLRKQLVKLQTEEGSYNQRLELLTIVKELGGELSKEEAELLSSSRIIKLTAKQMEDYWSDLAKDNFERCYLASRALAAASPQTIPLIKEQVKPVQVVPAEKVNRLIADLDSESFKTREKATGELEQMGEAAEPALRKIISGSPSLEVNKRIEELLAKIESLSMPIRRSWAIEILEQIGTPEAQSLLQELAKGNPEAASTQEAKAALERLAKQHSGP